MEIMVLIQRGGGFLFSKILCWACFNKDSSFSKSYSVWLKDTLCDFQSDYVQHQYRVAEKHKELKEYLGDFRKGKETDINRLSGLVESLEYTLMLDAKRASELAINSFEKYFCLDERKNHLQPRVCTKIFCEGLISDLERGSHSSPLNTSNCVDASTPYPVDENTGFKNIHNGGAHYLENNIPEKAKNGTYENRRINPKTVKNYNPPGIKWKLKRLLDPGNKDLCDPDWEERWDGGEPFENTTYKSTLIVPMTLRVNSLEESFFSSLLREDEEDSDKKILGYLCFDHRHINYFNDFLDIKTGWMIADIISFYLMNMKIYADRSDSFNEANTLLDKFKNTSTAV